MSTASGSMIWMNQTGNTLFRAWGLQFASALSGAGLVQTSDTGQINWTTVTAPGSGSTYAGYEIWRFNDSLQATKPVFIKVEYGAAPNTIGAGLRFSVSNATNGAGTLSGTITTTTLTVVGHYANNDVNPQPWFASGDTSSVVVVWPTCPFSNGWRPSMFMVERTRDSNGAANGDGVAFSTVQGYGAGSSGTTYGDSFSILMSYLNTSATAANRWLPIASPGVFSYWDAAGATGTDVNLFPYLVATPKPEAQMMSVLGCYAFAFPQQVTTSVVVNGATHTYLALGSQMYASSFPGPANTYAASTSLQYASNVATTSLLIRWE